MKQLKKLVRKNKWKKSLRPFDFSKKQSRGLIITSFSGSWRFTDEYLAELEQEDRMATKERYQNPVTDDDVNLRLFTYNSNNLADVEDVVKVDIYYLDPNERTDANPTGKRFIETFDGSVVTLEDTGTHLLALTLESPKYVVGRYIDEWTLNVINDEELRVVNNYFDVFPQLWYTTPIPVVYDFDFHFQPNKLRKGSKQYLRIEIKPNVPNATDLQRYYENLAVVAQISISIEQACVPCLPAESDLRLIIDDEPVPYREKRFGYYQLDTEDLECGIYNVWFKLEMGSNIYLSDKMQLQIF